MIRFPMTPAISCFLSAVLAMSPMAYGQSRSLQSVKNLVSMGQDSAALEELKNVKFENLTDAQKPLWHFTHGLLSYRAQNWNEAEKHLLKSVEMASNLTGYAYYLLGISQKNLGRLDDAKKSLHLSLKSKPAREVYYETRYTLGEIDMSNRNWKGAYEHFRYLQGRWKSSDKYPNVLHHLVETDLNLKQQWRACRWAINLYRNFPSAPVAQNWSIDLHQVDVAGRRLGCLASFNDQKRRIKRLQWAGESNRAREEIQILMKRTTKSTRYEVDNLLANFLIHEGFVKEALAVLLPYYEQKKSDYGYLNLVASAAAKGSEFRTAVGAYYRAHLITPVKSSPSREALFRAAFLSYQFQDYDGAFRKFERFRNLYPSSGLSRDSEWHMAWIRYLKGDYEGAIGAFENVYRQARKNWRHWRKYPTDKIQYWLAMAHYRKQSFDAARDLFEKIIKDEPLSFYAQAAKSRLETVPAPDQQTIRGLASAELENSDANSSLKTESGEALKEVSTLPPEAESEEILMAEESREDDLKANEVPVDDGDSVKGDDDLLFRSVKFQDQLNRALDLIQVGLYHWAKDELYEIEKRTRDREHRMRLVKAYESIQAYHRSSYIAEIYFGMDRRRGGLKGAEEQWKSSYPQAYAQEVTHFAKSFGVDRDFVWGLMRAESRYNKDVSSPVGARGLMQLMPYTAVQVSRLLGDESFDVTQLGQPAVNIRLGTRYLQRLSSKFKNQMPLMAAAYNAGPHRVESWLSSFGHLDMDEFIEHIPFVETRNYVKKVTRNYGVYKALYGSDLSPIAWLPKSIEIPPDTRPSSRENWESL